MALSSAAFVSNGFSFQPLVAQLRGTNFFQTQTVACSRPYAPLKAGEKKSRRTRRFPVMGKGRRHKVSPRSSKSVSMEKLARGVNSLWQNASSSERVFICSAGIAAVAVASIAVNMLFHVSLILAFAVVPLLMAPILLTIMASLAAFAFLTFATAGAGFFFIGTPFFALSLVAKALFPIFLVGGLVSLIASRFLGFSKAGDVVDPIDFEEVDELERFDRILRNRQTSKSTDIATWSLSEVVDELDYTGLGEYRQLFIEERIDGPTLLALTDEDIRTEFGTTMPLGDRMRLVRLISQLKRRSSLLP